MSFPLGRSITWMALIAVAGGAWMTIHRQPERADLTLWVFATPQFHDYREGLVPIFTQRERKSVDVELVTTRAMDMRLPVMFMSPGRAQDLPDAVELAIESVGLYLRPPTDQIDLLPLNHYLETSGFRTIPSLEAPGKPGWNARLATDGRVYAFGSGAWMLNPSRARPDAWIDRISANRLTASAKQGLIFGLPHDVHPVALAFREDLFREAGVPLIDDGGRTTVHTWSEFQSRCVTYQLYWQAHGFPNRHAIELPLTNSGALSILLAQRRINLVDADYTVHIDDPKVAQTLAFYVQLVAGERKIGAETAADSGLEMKDFIDGNLGALLMPDWKVASFRELAPSVAGKLRMIPLPRFDSDDAPTGSYGGTLIGIPRASPQPDEAWNLIEFLYLSPEGLADRKKLGILPPLPEEWDNPEYHQPDSYFGGQKTLELYADLARQAPPVYTTPSSMLALGTLSYYQSQAVDRVRSRGAQGLEHQCQVWLDEAAIDLRRRIEHARFN